MSERKPTYTRFAVAIVLVLVPIGYLAVSGARDKDMTSYYKTIQEIQTMGPGVYEKRLRVAGTVAEGSIKRNGTHVEFKLEEQGRLLPVVYNGTEAPPDTFKDKSQALAEGKMGRDGVFHAQKLQAKCASKYAPAPNSTTPGTNQATTQPGANQASM
ncbi:MAG TPA: cytochrome c maturation protein CcmE [Candidatus Koribacter sp.]|jgi:cytochrome c-type biogenesis protein CcmE